MEKKKIGLITGGGTGSELGKYFKLVCNAIAEANDLRIDIIEYPHVFKTYYDVRNLNRDEVGQIVKEDCNKLQKAYRQFHNDGCNVIFRTALNAETLYLARRQMRGIKIVPIQVGAHKITFVRDLMQGFYTQDYYNVSANEINFTGSFSVDKFNTIINYLKGNLIKFPTGEIPLWFLYKHHLFGNTIESWIKNQLPDAEVYQPDTGIDKLFHYLKKPVNDLLLVAGNEIGDILHEAIILHLGLGNKNTSYTRNIFLDKDLHGLAEYQTVHGSVDDLVGTGKLNPTAMLRVVGSMFGHHLNIPECERLVEQIIGDLKESRILTPDAGGNNTTEEVINKFISRLDEHYVKA